MNHAPRLAVAALPLALACAKAGIDPFAVDAGGGPATPTGSGGAGGAAGSGARPDFDFPGRGGSGGSGGAGRAPDGGPAASAALGDGGCNRLDVKFDKTIPTVALVVDRSSSMHDKYGAGTRWEVLKKALMDPMTGLVKTNESQVRFGLVTYTSTQRAPSCPWLGEVDFALGNFAAISKYYEPLLPPTPQEKGETPTGESIAAVTAKLEKVNEPGPKYIVLATDGDPDTCPGSCTGNCPVPDRGGWPRDPNCGQDRSVAAVQAAFAKGIRTFVLAIGDDVKADHLQALANAGAGLPVTLGSDANWLQFSCNLPQAMWKGTYADGAAATMKAKYYRPTDAATLARDLTTIVASVRSCKFTLKGEVDLMYANQGEVLLDGARLVHGDGDGWRMNSPTELELLGKACMDLQSGERSVKIGFPCSYFRPIE